MDHRARDWLEGLRAFATDPRRRPRPDPDATPAQAAGERGLIAASFTAWFDTELPGLLAGHDGSRTPAIVVTTSATGLAAADAVLGRDDPLVALRRPLVACVSELEYRLWCNRHPDPEHRLHLNHWNWIKTRVPRQRWPAFARHPLADGETYWIHRTGTAAAGHRRRSSGLWKWNGRTATLLEPRFEERVAGL